MKEFYALYNQVKEGKMLRVHTEFKTGEGGSIKIYEGTGLQKRQILKVEVEEVEERAGCYKRAKNALQNWANRQ